MTARTSPPNALWRRLLQTGVAVALLAGPAAAEPPPPTPPGEAASGLSPHDRAVVDRVTWGVDEAAVAQVRREGLSAWLSHQLHPGRGDPLPPLAQAQVDAMTISQESVEQLAAENLARHKALAALKADPDARRAAREADRKAVYALAQQVESRALLRDLYSPNQLETQLAWFWLNHFNVFARKGDVGVYLADYEDHAIGDHALGRFRDLLSATLHSPAMLIYLDNAQNAAGHINENYAREIMELHTLGVGGGYSQKDVQELARILTGVGINPGNPPPNVRPRLRGQYVRQGVFEFNPNRHDYGDKVFLGHHIRGSGLSEVSEALDLLSRSPVTARHVSTQLAAYFVADTPPPALVDKMTATWLHTDGDMAQVLQTMFRAPEFGASLGHKFKDPMHYVLSSVRLAYGDRVIENTGPVRNWLARLGEPLYGHETPDGYPMTQAAWAGPGEMATRFEIARIIGAGARGLYTPAPPAGAPTPLSEPALAQAAPPPVIPHVDRVLYRTDAAPALSQGSREALGAATTPADWSALYLSAPEFMFR